MRVEFAPRARLDLIEIAEHLERVAGKRTAVRWIERLAAKARGLMDQPYIGAEDSELGGRRRLILRPYLIVYRIASPDLVRVVRVVHGARDLPMLFAGDPD